jgi:hypothetical protein
MGINLDITRLLKSDTNERSVIFSAIMTSAQTKRKTPEHFCDAYNVLITYPNPRWQHLLA